jgi:hypothetical protein
MLDKAVLREALEIMLPNSHVTWDCFQDKFTIQISAYGVGEFRAMLEKSYPYKELKKENEELRRALFDLVPAMICDGEDNYGN